MKKFFVIFEYEFMNYLKNKSFMITTILIALIAGAAMFLPSIFDMSDLLGIETGTSVDSPVGGDTDDDTDDGTDGEEKTMLIYDKSGAFVDLTMLEAYFGGVKWEKISDIEAIKTKVENEEAEAGFVVDSLTSYTYYVHNRDMNDNNKILFEGVLTVMNQMKYCVDNNLNYRM